MSDPVEVKEQPRKPSLADLWKAMEYVRMVDEAEVTGEADDKAAAEEAERTD